MHALAHVVAQSSEFCLRTQDLLGRGPGGRSPECLGEVATGHVADYLASFKDLVTSNSVCRAACVLGCSPTSTLMLKISHNLLRTLNPGPQSRNPDIQRGRVVRRWLTAGCCSPCQVELQVVVLNLAQPALASRLCHSCRRCGSGLSRLPLTIKW